MTVQVNEGAPGSATFTVIEIVTEAAWTGLVENTMKTANNTAHARSTALSVAPRLLIQLFME